MVNVFPILRFFLSMITSAFVLALRSPDFSTWEIVKEERDWILEAESKPPYGSIGVTRDSQIPMESRLGASERGRALRSRQE